MNNQVQEKIIKGHKTGGLVLFLTIVAYIAAGPVLGMCASAGLWPVSVLCGLYLAVLPPYLPISVPSRTRR